MSVEIKLKKFKDTLETKLLEKFAKQNLNLGFEILPGTTSTRMRLEVYNKRRPPTQFGRKQGAHTVAYSAVLRSLTWLFEDVTMMKARELLIDFHWNLYALYILCVDSALEPNYLDRIKQLADLVHEELRKGIGTRAETPQLIRDYLTLFLYLHNLLPDAAVDEKSFNRGEYEALNRLEKMSLHSWNAAKDKAGIIANLSILIDEKAILASLLQSGNLGAPLIGFQLLGINRILSGLPNFSNLVFGCDLTSQRLKERMTDENLISDLNKIVFYKFNDAHAVLSWKAQSNDQSRSMLIKEALNWIYALHHSVNGQAPYGTIARA